MYIFIVPAPAFYFYIFFYHSLLILFTIHIHEYIVKTQFVTVLNRKKKKNYVMKPTVLRFFFFAIQQHKSQLSWKYVAN